MSYKKKEDVVKHPKKRKYKKVSVKEREKNLEKDMTKRSYLKENLRK